MKRKPVVLASVVFAFAFALALSGCATTQSGGSHTLDKREFPFAVQWSTESDVQDREISLYFVDGGEVPYVALSEYLPIVGEFFSDESADPIEFDIQAENDGVTVTREDNGSTMGIDAKADTLTFDNYDAFMMMPGSVTMMGIAIPAEADSIWADSLFQDAGMSYERAGAALTMSLADYSIDIIAQDGEVYLPLQTIDDVLVAGKYVSVIFNGQKVLASGYECELINEQYEAPTGEMSEELSAFNYNELRFLLDHYYGLAQEHDVESFAQYFADAGLTEYLTGTDPKAFDAALERFINLYLDDLHSAFLQPSYLSGPYSDWEGSDEDPQDAYDWEDSADEQQDVFGSADEQDSYVWQSGKASSDFETADEIASNARAKYYPELTDADENSVFLYEEVGDTAIITFDSFTPGEDEYSSGDDLANAQDTIALISYAHQQITREGSPIKNVVMDLSNNHGGEARSALFTIAWFKGVAQISLRDTLTEAKSVSSYRADINFDGQFDDADRLPDDLNLYCLTSQTSFSCGNLVPAAFKDSPNITMIGRTTGGGACIVLPATTAIGTSFQISGTTQIGTLKNGSFYSADTGIEPDVAISKWDTFYDREALAAFIHDLE